MMTYEAVALENKEHIGTIRFNRPEQMNAVNTHLTAELLDALLRLDRDDEVRVVIITGTGNAFCAGLDIAEAIGRIEENRPILSSPSHMVPAQMSVPSAIPGEYLFPLFLPFLEEQRTIFSQPPHEKGECNT
jgi:enoyl-CoA hydratase/carnithine racemase